jgi:hypothetical protein
VALLCVTLIFGGRRSRDKAKGAHQLIAKEADNSPCV